MEVGKQVSQKRVVVIDDDRDFLEYTQIILHSAGYWVETAISASEGLALVRSTLPDLIIIDVMMSFALEGIELARDITQDPALAHIPVLVVTSIARTMDAVGFDETTARAIKGFLTKPVLPDELLTQVSSFLEGR